MKSILKLITATFIALAPINAVAQSNVAHINVQQLISEMPEVIAAQNELAKLEKDYTTQIDNAFKEFHHHLNKIFQKEYYLYYYYMFLKIQSLFVLLKQIYQTI